MTIRLMRRGQATIEALLAILLLGIALVAGLATAQRGLTAARVAVDAVGDPVTSTVPDAARRGQAVVEATVLVPLLLVAVTLLVAGWLRLGDVARAERALSASQAAIAAGEPIPPLVERWKATATRHGDRLVVRVPSPLADVVLDAPLPAVP